MRLDQFTVKAQEAMTAAQTAAEKADHPEVTPEHLLAPCDPGRRRRPGRPRQDGRRHRGPRARTWTAALGALPHTQGAATQLSPQLDGVLKQALREAEALKDQYVSTEHLLLALAESKTPRGEVLKRHGRHPRRAC